MDFRKEKLYDIKSGNILYAEDYIDSINFNKKAITALVKILAEKDVLDKEDLSEINYQSCK